MYYIWFVCGMNIQEDLDTIDKMIADGEAAYNKWRHPDPYIGKDLIKLIRFAS